MAQAIARQTHFLFGAEAVADNPTQFAEFGSQAAGDPIKTTNILDIQAGSAWTDGWAAALYAGNKALLLEDLNSWCYEHSYQVAYILEMGLPEWDSDTTYSIGSVVQGAYGSSAAGQWFESLQDSNLGNPPAAGGSTAAWKLVNPGTALLSGLATGAIPKVSGTTPTTGPAGSQTLVAGLLSDDGTNVIIGGVAGTNGLKFADSTVQRTAASPITTQSDVTGSRAANTLYQNTTGKVMFVFVTLTGSNGGGTFYSGIALVGPTSTPTTNLGTAEANGNGNGTAVLPFIVLPGYYYKVSVTVGSMIKWIECF